MSARAKTGRAGAATRSAFAGSTLLAAGAIAAGALGASGDGVLDTTLASRAGGATGAVGDGSSFDPSTSADGRYVAFHSDADNLDDDSNDAVTDVFVRDLQANTTTLASRATGVAGAVGDGDSFGASISADGRYVALYSDAGNLDPDSNDAVADVFVRDLQANTTTLVSRATGAAGAVGDGESALPSISGDGHHVAFQSGADNLDSDSDDSVNDIFVRDLQSDATTLASRATGAAGAVGDSFSHIPSISADGRHVAFFSDAGNLDDDSNDVVFDAFVRDLQANTTTLVSRATGAAGAVGDAHSVSQSISADGRYVAFHSEADNLDDDSNDEVADAFVRDLQANTTTLVSRATGAAGTAGDQQSSSPSISADGRYVAFDSQAGNLDDDPESNAFDANVFVRDLQANTTTLVSRATGAAGAVGDQRSGNGSISADGRYVAFGSQAGNLDAESNDAFDDVFVRELIDTITARCGGKTATEVGTGGRDKLKGSERRDVITGLGGKDVIKGLAGNDLLCGGKGSDRLLGGAGKDKLFGQKGKDTLKGGPGKDKLKGGAAKDKQVQ